MDRIVMRVWMHLLFIISRFIYYEYLVLNEYIRWWWYTMAEFIKPTVLLFKLHFFHFVEHLCSLFFSISPTLIFILFVSCEVLLVRSRYIVVFTSISLASFLQGNTWPDFHHFMRLRIECLHHLAMIVVFEISTCS